jgi:hypothetical protein
MRQLIAPLFLALGISTVGFPGAADAQVRRGGTAIDRTESLVHTDDGVLNNERLLDMLRGLGYEPKVYNSGGTIYHLAVDKDGFHYEISLRLSPNGRQLWILNHFGARSYTMDEMRRLMEASATWGPAHFVFDSATRELSLRLAIDNRNITQDWLRTEIDFYMHVVRTTEPLWGAPRS